MDIQTAIAILELLQSERIYPGCRYGNSSITAAGAKINEFQNNTNAASPQGIRVFSPKIKANVRVE